MQQETIHQIVSADRTFVTGVEAAGSIQIHWNRIQLKRKLDDSRRKLSSHLFQKKKEKKEIIITIFFSNIFERENFFFMRWNLKLNSNWFQNGNDCWTSNGTPRRKVTVGPTGDSRQAAANSWRGAGDDASRRTESNRLPPQVVNRRPSIRLRTDEESGHRGTYREKW